jgi:hypothetical protein
MHTSLSLHFIDAQCLDVFRALLAHPQEALHERRIGDLCAVVDVDWSQGMGRRKTAVFPYPETNPHLQLHTIVTNSAFL